MTRVALVTEPARGIAAATVRALEASGQAVLAADRFSDDPTLLCASGDHVVRSRTSPQSGSISSWNDSCHAYSCGERPAPVDVASRCAQHLAAVRLQSAAGGPLAGTLRLSSNTAWSPGHSSRTSPGIPARIGGLALSGWTASVSGSRVTVPCIVVFRN